MFKKYLTAIATAIALCSTAQAAITNAGFETGDTTNWQSNPDLIATDSAQIDLGLYDRASGNLDIASIKVAPVEGSFFGLYMPVDLDNPGALAPYVPSTSAAGSNTYTTSLWNTASGGTAGSPETVWLRLITGDFASNVGAAFNDTVELFFSGIGTRVAVESQYMTSADSGWIGFSVPTGATGLQLNVIDYYGDGIANSPIVAVDYSLSAIPEPTSVLMMLAGLGALGFKGRRSLKVKTSSAAAA